MGKFFTAAVVAALTGLSGVAHASEGGEPLPEVHWSWNGIFGTFDRAERTGGVGCLLAAVGISVLALAPSVPMAVGATLLQGVGIGLLTSHLAPVFVRSTPKSHLTRLQSLLSLVQTVPLIVSMNLLATLDVRHALILAAATTALAGLMLLRAYLPKSISKVG